MSTAKDKLSTPVRGARRTGEQAKICIDHRLIKFILLNLLCLIQFKTITCFPTIPQSHFMGEHPMETFAGMPPGLINMGNFPPMGSGDEPMFPDFAELMKNCTNCKDPGEVFREKMEEARIERFKEEILKKLNISKPPNISGRPDFSFSKPVRKLLEREREELRQNRQTTGSTTFAEIKEIVSYGEEGKQDIASNMSENDLVMFRLPNNIQSPSLKVMSASLYILLRYKKQFHPHPPDKTNRRVKIKIYAVNLSQYERYEEPRHNGTLLGSLGVFVRHTRWQKLNLPVSEIQKVLDSNNKQLTLKITCDNCGQEIYPVLVTKRPFSRKRVRAGQKRKLNRRRPLLIVHTAVEPQAAGHSIQKRSSLLPIARPQHKCTRHRKNRGRCHKRKLWVSFKDIGWADWILIPKGYYANYCEGSCPWGSIHDLLSSSHAQVVSSYSRLSDKHRKTPCCKPRKMAPLHLVYFDDNGNIVKTLINGMTAEKCGCA